MTDEGRRGTLDAVRSTCREAAYLNECDAADGISAAAELGVKQARSPALFYASRHFRYNGRENTGG